MSVSHQFDRHAMDFGARFHSRDSSIVVSESLNSMIFMREDSPLNVKATHIPNSTPQSVIDFFLQEPLETIHPLTHNANPRNIFIAQIHDGEAQLPLSFKNAVNREVSEYLEKVCAHMAAQTLNAEKGSSANEVQMVITENIATKAFKNFRTANLHIDPPRSLSKRQLHGHIGISDATNNFEGQADTRELEYLTVGVGDDTLSHDYILRNLIGFNGFAQEHETLSSKMDHTKTGDFLAFWSTFMGKNDVSQHTLAHRTDPSKSNPQDGKRRYSVTMFAVRPPDMDFGLDYL